MLVQVTAALKQIYSEIVGDLQRFNALVISLYCNAFASRGV